MLLLNKNNQKRKKGILKAILMIASFIITITLSSQIYVLFHVNINDHKNKKYNHTSINDNISPRKSNDTYKLRNSTMNTGQNISSISNNNSINANDTITTKTLQIKLPKIDHNISKHGGKKPIVVYLHHDNRQKNNKSTKSKKQIGTKSNKLNENTQTSSYPEEYYEYDYYFRKAQLYDILRKKEYHDEKTNTTCTAIKQWQRKSYSTCNILHEQHLFINNYIASGMYRNVWKTNDNTVSSSYVVLKTYKLGRLFIESIYDQHKRESIAMDQMKGSKYINNIYANCGTSSIFEYVDSNLSLKEYISLYYNTSKMKSKDILNIATDVAKALSDSHVFVYDRNSEKHYATIAHNDLKPEQYIYSKKHKRFILTDFNRCTFLTRNQTITNKEGYYHCEIPTNTKHRSKLKSPEDYIPTLPVTDKSDVYVLGNILYYILTSHYPYDYTTKNNKQAIELIVHGNKLPSLPDYFLNDKKITAENPYIKIVVDAMYKCFTYDCRKRPSSFDIVRYLDTNKKQIIA